MNRPRPPARPTPSAPCRARTVRRVWGASGALALLLAACPPAAPGQIVVDRGALLAQQRKQRETQYKMNQQRVAAMQPLPARRIDDVLRLKMDGRDLTLLSPLAEPGHDTGEFRLESDLFRGPTSAQVLQVNMGPMAGGRANGLTRMLVIASYEFPNPDELDTLSVQSYPGYIQVFRQSQIGSGGFRMTRLVQQRPPGGAAGQGMVQLFVNESGDAVAPGGVAQNFTLQAPDFQSLLRDNGRQAGEFVRPLLRQIGQESILAPGEEVAWQVLCDFWRPDPQVARRVRELLPALNDADFHARDRALDEMRKLGKAGAAALSHLDRAGLSPEQNLAIDRGLAPWAQLPAKEAARLRDDSDFLLDCLYNNDPEIRAAALARLRQVTGKDLPFNLDTPEPDRAAAVSALRRQLDGGAAAGPTTGPAKS